MTRVVTGIEPSIRVGLPQGWKSISELWENSPHGEVEHV